MGYTRIQRTGIDAHSSCKPHCADLRSQFHKKSKSFPSLQNLSPILAKSGQRRVHFFGVSFDTDYSPVEQASLMLYADINFAPECSLRAKNPVTGITEARQDVAVAVELAVDGGAVKRGGV